MVVGGSQECYRSGSEPDDLAGRANQPIISMADGLNGIAKGMDMGKAYDNRAIHQRDLALFRRCR